MANVGICVKLITFVKCYINESEKTIRPNTRPHNSLETFSRNRIGCQEPWGAFYKTMNSPVHSTATAIAAKRHGGVIGHGRRVHATWSSRVRE